MADADRDFEAEVKVAYPAMIRFAAVLCWSSGDVEDVVQETVLRAFRSYPSFRAEAAFLTWACAILARVAADANRRRSRAEMSEMPLRTDSLPPVDAAVIEDEAARRVIDAIRALPRRQREMATLHFLDERPYREIAEALSVSVGTVKATIFTAKQSLRAALADEPEVS